MVTNNCYLLYTIYLRTGLIKRFIKIDQGICAFVVIESKLIIKRTDNVNYNYFA